MEKRDFHVETHVKLAVSMSIPYQQQHGMLDPKRVFHVNTFYVREMLWNPVIDMGTT